MDYYFVGALCRLQRRGTSSKATCWRVYSSCPLRVGIVRESGFSLINVQDLFLSGFCFLPPQTQLLGRPAHNVRSSPRRPCALAMIDCLRCEQQAYPCLCGTWNECCPRQTYYSVRPLRDGQEQKTPSQLRVVTASVGRCLRTRVSRAPKPFHQTDSIDIFSLPGNYLENFRRLDKTQAHTTRKNKRTGGKTDCQSFAATTLKTKERTVR